MTWSIFITPTAQRMLRDIPDERVRGKLHAAIDRLKQDPEKQGAALLANLRDSGAFAPSASGIASCIEFTRSG